MRHHDSDPLFETKATQRVIDSSSNGFADLESSEPLAHDNAL
jgi:hypothetical protein